LLPDNGVIGVGSPGPNQTRGLPRNAHPLHRGEQQANLAQILIPFVVSRHPYNTDWIGGTGFGKPYAIENSFLRSKLYHQNDMRRCRIEIDWKQFQ
jgi:hypothetical protein